MSACAFCGSSGSLTREHVLPQWLGRIGLDDSPVQHAASALNGMPRRMGEQRPFQQTVKSFCASCNNGWMSDLEYVAQRVLTPLILGEPGTIEPEDQAAIAMWAQKTALTGMLLSSAEERANGYGLAAAEYHAFYGRSRALAPLEDSQFWIGRFEGPTGFSAVHVTPMTVSVRGVQEPGPQGYLTTIVLGELVIHGLRFTTPGLPIKVAMDGGMPQFWPTQGAVVWPDGSPATYEMFRPFAMGAMLRSTVEGVELGTWRHATDMPDSIALNGIVQLPVPCGHAVYFPGSVVQQAMMGIRFVFLAGCDCGAGYLVQTEVDRSVIKLGGDSPEQLEQLEELYEQIDGDEFLIESFGGEFFVKRLPAGVTFSAGHRGVIPVS